MAGELGFRGQPVSLSRGQRQPGTAPCDFRGTARRGRPPQPNPAAAPGEPALLLSPAYDPQVNSEEQRRNVAGYLAEVARTVNTLNERQSVFAGRLVGAEARQHPGGGGDFGSRRPNLVPGPGELSRGGAPPWRHCTGASMIHDTAA
eukprot:8138451-Alexandrium_andersonii.AAC.1